MRGRGHVLHLRSKHRGVGGRPLTLLTRDPVWEEDVGVGEVGGERGQRPSENTSKDHHNEQYHCNFYPPSELRHGACPGAGVGARVDVVSEDWGRGLGGAGPEVSQSYC